MKIIISALSFLLFVFTAHSKDSLIPLEVFAKHSSFTDMKISPKGEFIAFTYEEGTEVKLAIMSQKTNKILSSFAFGENRHVTNFEWLNDNRIGMFVSTVIGWLDGTNPKTRWVAANANGTKRVTLGYFEQYSLSMISRLKNEPKFILVTKQHWSNKGQVKLNKLNIYNGKLNYISESPHTARHSTPGVVALMVDLNDEVSFAYEFDRGIDFADEEDDRGYFHYKDNNKVWQRLSLPNVRSTRPQFNFIGMSANNRFAYFTSNFDMKESDTLGLFKFDLESKKIVFVFRHDDVDVTSGLYGSDEQLIGVYLEPGYPQVHFLENDENRNDILQLKSLKLSFKGQYTSLISQTEDNEKSIVRVRSDSNPGEYYLLDNKLKRLSYIASSKSEVISNKMAKVEPFTLMSRDGMKLYGLLTIPNDVKEKQLPMVVYPHGGPYGVRDNWGWDRRAQMLASRGYLVLQVNFRGSGGFGRDFQEAGYGEQGAKMQDDITDATRWAIEAGLADPERICIHGVSYGGQATLSGVVMEPRLYKCGIPDAGVYDIELQLHEADYVRGRNGSKVRESQFKRRIGGKENNEERSPVFHLDKLQAKLLIVHGGEDKRVPIDHAFLLEKKLKEKNIKYEKLFKRKEGHGFTKVNNRVELYESILNFLEENIGKNTKN